ncbi:MAG: bifunctional metallophosphatase/5'-nucleotidase [Bacteroidaceae bacterium]|nr:bifunctional metallophosphatase/5'-nucleotidase [Bacteroidaceae bacterium]
MRLSRSIECLLLSALCIAFTECSDRHSAVTIRLIATSDTHGCIFADDCLDGSERMGSLAKFSTFIKGERSKNRNVIYLDAGDILQGSIELYHDKTAQFVRDNLPAKAFNLLGCDAAVMGNHDLAAGSQTYSGFIRSIQFPLLCANLRYPDSQYFLPPYTIIEKQGVKIAVLGLITPSVDFTIPEDLMGELKVSDPVETARYWVPVLKEREKADVVVGLFHSGYNGGRVASDGSLENVVCSILDKVPGFDVIVYGHDHVSRCLKMADCQGDSVLLVNPGPYAQKAAAATLTVQMGKDGASVSSTGQLVDITTQKPDSKFVSALSGWHNDVVQYADSVIGTSAIPLEVNAALWRDVSVLDLVHSTQMRFMGAQVSLTAPVPTVLTVPAGPFKVRDMFRLYQFENNMVSVLLTGSQIKDVLEYSAGLFYNTVGKGTDHLLKLKKDPVSGKMVPENPASSFLTASGIDYTIDVTKPEGNRVRIVSMSNGEKFDADKQYRTTINTYLYSGTESVLLKATGMTASEMKKRFQASASADIRYYILTKFAVNAEVDKAVKIDKYNNWKLVPERTVDGYLSKDTIDFELITIK